LWLKSDAANPTGALKDRPITVSATKTVEFGYSLLCCDSTGNKASSGGAKIWIHNGPGLDTMRFASSTRRYPWLLAELSLE
jgi:hypothetical protein